MYVYKSGSFNSSQPKIDNGTAPNTHICMHVMLLYTWRNIFAISKARLGNFSVYYCFSYAVSLAVYIGGEYTNSANII